MTLLKPPTRHSRQQHIQKELAAIVACKSQTDQDVGNTRDGGCSDVLHQVFQCRAHCESVPGRLGDAPGTSSRGGLEAGRGLLGSRMPRLRSSKAVLPARTSLPLSRSWN